MAVPEIQQQQTPPYPVATFVPNTNNGNQQPPPYERLGYRVYRTHYPELYESRYKGCAGMPLNFWLWLLGFFFFPMWIISSFFIFTSNQYERLWSRISALSILITLTIAIVVLSLIPIYV